jgi:ribosomal protein S24E
MSIIETITDVTNPFLSRRELTCNFAGLGGKLKSLEAVDMILKEFKLDGKVVIPMRLKTQVGKSLVTGTFYVYEDEGLAKKHINPTIFSRIEKAKAKIAEAEAAAKEAEVADAPAEEAKADAPAEEAKADAPAEEAKADAPAEEAKADAPAEEAKKEEKSE